MAYYYAQLNENNICIGVSQLSGEVDGINMISISSMDTDYIWRKYENGQWSEEKFEPQSTAPITEFEQLKQNNEDLKQSIAELTTIIALMQI